MNELTLESPAKRVEALEKSLANHRPGRPRNDWRKVVGKFRDREIMREVDQECLRMREAEPQAARLAEPLE